MVETKFMSIGMPIYNGALFIRRALDSLLSQTYKNFELIISDDASSDETSLICQDYLKRDARIKFFRQPQNLGLVKNFAFVLNLAQGEYFMWAAQDDWWDKRFIEKMLEALKKNPKYVVAMSHFKIKRESGEIEETPLGRHDFTHSSNYRLFKTILEARDNPIFEYGLWRQDFLKKLFSRFKPETIEDTITLMAEAGLAGKFYSVPEVLYVKYRDPRPLRERHYLGDYYKKPYPYTKFIFSALYWFLTSSVIPWRRKVLVFGPWFEMAWRYKGKIFKEIRAAL